MKIMSINKYPHDREECVEYVKDLGNYLTRNADVIVGDIHNVTSILLTFNLELQSVPTLTVEKVMNVNVDE